MQLLESQVDALEDEVSQLKKELQGCRRDISKKQHQLNSAKEKLRGFQATQEKIASKWYRRGQASMRDRLEADLRREGLDAAAHLVYATPVAKWDTEHHPKNRVIADQDTEQSTDEG